MCLIIKVALWKWSEFQPSDHPTFPTTMADSFALPEEEGRQGNSMKVFSKICLMNIGNNWRSGS